MLAEGPCFAPATPPGGRSVAPDAVAPERSLAVVETGAPQRDRIEACIANVYRSRYGARISRWAPTLVGLIGDERILAAAGYRDATDPLFLERYLAAPIEEVIAARTGAPVTRREIVEVGHFAAAHPGEGKRLLPMLARHLSQRGFQFRLNRVGAGLHLPAGIGCAIVRQSQSKGTHLGQPIYSDDRE